MRRINCSVFTDSNGRPSDRILESNVGRYRVVAQYFAPWYAPTRPAVAPPVGSGVLASIQRDHLISSRPIALATFASGGSTLSKHEGGWVVYSSPSSPKL